MQTCCGFQHHRSCCLPKILTKTPPAGRVRFKAANKIMRIMEWLAARSHEPIGKERVGPTSMKSSSRRLYDFKQSPFYGMRSKRDLATLLHIDLAELRNLLRAQDADLYSEIAIRKTANLCLERTVSRLAEVPRRPLRQVHKRLLAILTRIIVPKYVHCSVKDRSYITNARAHRGTGATVVLDLRRFYRR